MRLFWLCVNMMLSNTQNPAADARLSRGGLPRLPGPVPPSLRRLVPRHRDGGLVRLARGRVHGGQGIDEDHQLPRCFEADPEGHRAGVHQECQRPPGEKEARALMLWQPQQLHVVSCSSVVVFRVTNDNDIPLVFCSCVP